LLASVTLQPYHVLRPLWYFPLLYPEAQACIPDHMILYFITKTTITLLNEILYCTLLHLSVMPSPSGGFRGVDMEQCPPPSGRPVFFQHVVIYIAKIMGLLHGSRVQRKVRYFIYYSHRDIELDCESNIDEFGPKNRREFSNILVNSSKLFGFTF